MAKKQSFGDKVLKKKSGSRKMVKLIVATKKPNGSYSYVHRMVDQSEVQAELKAAKS
jgi:hypothetical protein